MYVVESQTYYLLRCNAVWIIQEGAFMRSDVDGEEFFLWMKWIKTGFLFLTVILGYMFLPFPILKLIG